MACHTIGISCVARLARADSLVLLGNAVGILGAGAGVHTLLLGALECERAVVILETLIGVAPLVGIALVAVQARAHRLVRLGRANGIVTAGVIKQTGIDTISLDTCFVKRTFQVMLTSS